MESIRTYGRYCHEFDRNERLIMNFKDKNRQKNVNIRIFSAAHTTLRQLLVKMTLKIYALVFGQSLNFSIYNVDRLFFLLTFFYS